ncbi:hypothetical protein TrRE_jg12871 [Triparma retinervis]|uniref:Intradiol ring-cleavage dioxygenases domain-containing protein n=1 Tax=Triparma retinervis TaxID=2557542 RepID=A0A9W7FXE9_9STRA|nr:hypothetical protein TrRE_jg12871 [Triparma retinervis]
MSCPPYNQDLITPQDVQGPFYIPPLDVPNPELFPEREVACVTQPVCSGGGACSELEYSSGLPLRLSGQVFGTDDDGDCWVVQGARVDFWSADVVGQYWSVDDFWRRGLEGGEEEEHSGHYNCRAHATTNEEGLYSFESLMPGHYVAGSAWRPRHIHMKVTAEGLADVVTQVYFEGDPLLFEMDTACGSCKSDHPDLIVGVQMHEGEGQDGTEFELGMLETLGV